MIVSHTVHRPETIIFDIRFQDDEQYAKRGWPGGYIFVRRSIGWQAYILDRIGSSPNPRRW